MAAEQEVGVEEIEGERQEEVIDVAELHELVDQADLATKLMIKKLLDKRPREPRVCDLVIADTRVARCLEGYRVNEPEVVSTRIIYDVDPRSGFVANLEVGPTRISLWNRVSEDPVLNIMQYATKRGIHDIRPVSGCKLEVMQSKGFGEYLSWRIIDKELGTKERVKLLTQQFLLIWTMVH